MLIQSFEGIEPRHNPCDFYHLLYTTTGRPYDNHWTTMMQIDQNLSAALYMLGFNFLDGFSEKIAEIKGDMIITLVHPPGEELKFVVELPGEKQMIFSLDQHQIVNLAEQLTCDQARGPR